MLSLLETLPNDYQRKVGTIISINELTIFSLMLNKTSALVGTNKKLIFCTKRLNFFKKNYYFHWSEICQVKVSENKNSCLKLHIITKAGAWDIDVDKEKIYLLTSLTIKLEEIIKKANKKYNLCR